jgi:hypothetical protein
LYPGLVHLFYDVLHYYTLERQLSTISTVPGRSHSSQCILNHGILQAQQAIAIAKITCDNEQKYLTLRTTRNMDLVVTRVRDLLQALAEVIKYQVEIA